MKIFEFNKGQSGTLIDSVSKTKGTLTAGTGGFKKTEKGQAMLFDGSDTDIDFVSNGVIGTGDFSISIWADLSRVVGAAQRMLRTGASSGADDGWGLWYNEDNGKIGTAISNGTNRIINDQSYTTKSGLVNIISVFDRSGNIETFVDNVSIGTQDISFFSGDNITNTSNLIIGAEGVTNFNGVIGNVKLYNTVLTSQERADLQIEFERSFGTTEQKRNFVYPKATNLSSVDGLVAGYSMVPSSGGVLVDLSGNGNNGTINGALSSRDGMKFGTSTYVTLSSAIDFGTTHTLNFRLKIDADDTLVFLGTAANGNNFVYVGGKKLSYRSNATTVAGSAEVIVEGEEQTLTISRDGTSVHFYLNGSFVETLTVSNSNPLNGINQLFARQGGLGFNGNVVDVKFYNYAFTPQQAKDYHNSFAKPVLRETFSDSPVGATHTHGWTEVSGDGAIAEETTGNAIVPLGTKKWVQDTAGIRATQSKQAYGEWEFDTYKSGVVQSEYINFISDRIGGYNSSLGYHIRRGLDGELYLRRASIGSTSVLFQTANSYIDNNTWYRLKVARLASEGVFKDIPTLQVSDIINTTSQPYTTFVSGGRYGFSATSDGSSTQSIATADEIPIVNTAKYLVEFDLTLNSGTFPLLRFRYSEVSGAISNSYGAIEGKNSIIFTGISTQTGVFGFTNASSAADYTVSGLTIRRIYEADSFAVFIKGGDFGNEYNLVDTTGGSGSNPIVDATYTTSQYLVADLDAGDSFGNLLIKDGVEQ